MQMINDKWKIIFGIPVALSALFVPFSMLIGWNIFTLFLFWIVLMPLLTIYFPGWVSKKSNVLLKSLTGMGVFYALMIFMIYDHYKTDYFKLMVASFGINVITITATHYFTKPKAAPQNPSLS